MKNKFWAVGCGLGWTVGKKGLGQLWATFEASFFRGEKQVLESFFENTAASALKSCTEKR